MAGTANNFRIDGRIIGPGILWGGLPVPSASARLSLATVDSDGFITPDATANPAAYPIGATKGGIVCAMTSERQDFFADEINGPVDTKVQQVMMSISGEVIGLMDEKLAQLAMAGFGTYSTASGYKQNTVGFATDSFTGIALIAPQRADPTKVFIFHIYKAINVSGMQFTVTKTDMSSSPVEFRGYAVSTRTPADQMGNYWWQIA